MNINLFQQIYPFHSHQSVSRYDDMISHPNWDSSQTHLMNTRSIQRCSTEEPQSQRRQQVCKSNEWKTSPWEKLLGQPCLCMKLWFISRKNMKLIQAGIVSSFSNPFSEWSSLGSVLFESPFILWLRRVKHVMRICLILYESVSMSGNVLHGEMKTFI